MDGLGRRGPYRAPTRKGARALILESAVDLFADQGYDATSVQQIVERAGVTKGALYHHFSAKEDILFHIYGDVFAEQLAELDRILAFGQPPEQTLRAAIRSCVMSTARAAKAAAVFSQEVTRMSPEHYQEQQKEWRRYQDSVRDVIAKGQADGAFARTAPRTSSPGRCSGSPTRCTPGSSPTGRSRRRSSPPSWPTWSCTDSM
jgi:AcrR family transcriptional regulator